MSVKFDIGSALKVAREVKLLPGAIERVQERTISTLRRRIEPEAVKAVSARFNVSKSTLKPRFSAFQEEYGVNLTGTGTPIEIGEFGGYYGGRLTPGATWQKLVGGKRETIAGSFVPKTKWAKERIFQRADSKRAIGQRVRRLPIRGVYGPSAGSMLLSKEVGARLTEFGRAILTEEIARLIGVELNGL